MGGIFSTFQNVKLPDNSFKDIFQSVKLPFKDIFQSVKLPFKDTFQSVKLPFKLPFKDTSFGNKQNNLEKGISSGIIGHREVRVQVSNGSFLGPTTYQTRSESSTPLTVSGLFGEAIGNKISRLGGTEQEQKPIFSSSSKHLSNIEKSNIRQTQPFKQPQQKADAAAKKKAEEDAAKKTPDVKSQTTTPSADSTKPTPEASKEDSSKVEKSDGTKIKIPSGVNYDTASGVNFK